MSYEENKINLLTDKLNILNREAEIIRQEIQRLKYTEFEEDIIKSQNKTLLNG
jgi:hypothetical protein